MRNQKLYNNTNRFRFGGLREMVLERDGYKCVDCGMTNEEHLKTWNRNLTINHKDGTGINSKIKNNTMENLETLCLRCHGKKDRPRRKIFGPRPDRKNAKRDILTGKFI